MWVAVTLAVCGLLTVAVLTQLYGYRLGGTITIPILAVYALKDFVMLPVFVASTAIAFVGLLLLKRRTLIYGRDELVAAIVIGSLVPIAVLLAAPGSVVTGLPAVVFIGSILPGLAAYNVHQLKPEYRWPDLFATVGLLAALVALGWALVQPPIGARLGTATPAVLFSSTADIARLNGAVAAAPADISPIPRAVAVGVLTVGLFVAEAVRSRFDVRVGIITAALLAIFALDNGWFLVLYAVVFAASLAVMEAVNWLTLRYGRVLLGVGTAFGLVVALPVTVWLPIDQGLTAFFTAVIGGVSAYNAHATAPREIQLVLPLQVSVFVPTLLVVRAVAEPGPHGIPQTLSPVTWLASAVVVAAALLYARHVTIRQPSDETVLGSSVLREGGGT